MIRQRSPARFVLVLMSICAVSVAAEPPTTTGTITKVTVYRGQALVTRLIELQMPEDTSELVVKDLPSNIIPESIYAQSATEVKVLSVRYRQRAVAQDTREEVRQLEAQLEDVKHEYLYAESYHKGLQQQWQMYEKLKNFTVDATHHDLNKGLLTFEPIESLAELIESKAEQYLKARLELEDKMRELKKQQQLLERKLKELAASRSRTDREAVLFLSSPDKEVRIEVSYLVNGASWQQQYNLRADPEAGQVTIEYNAVVNQTSGEDWTAVSVSLSTAEPTLVAAPPVLQPLPVALAPGPQQAQQPVQQPQAVEQYWRFQKSRRDYLKKGPAASYELNELAAQNQMVYLNVGAGQLRDLQQRISEKTRSEGISVTYELPGKLTLPSRSDQQLVTIAAIKASAEFTLMATPLLTDYVYLQADVLNDSSTILLPGPASMFRNGEFVGKGQMPLVTIGETFTAGFGIDSQVQVRHELLDKQSRVQGGNRIDTYNYRITLSNYKNTAVKLRLLDRLPYSEDPAIKIELTKTEPQLSKDEQYQRNLRRKGILRWDLTLAPNTFGRNATAVTYSYTMEYDRNMGIRWRR